MSRLDRAVLLTLIMLALCAGLLVWRTSLVEVDTVDEAANVEQFHIVYMAGDERERYQLFVIALGKDQPYQLTQEPFGVWDYTILLLRAA